MDQQGQQTQPNVSRREEPTISAHWVKEAGRYSVVVNDADFRIGRLVPADMVVMTIGLLVDSFHKTKRELDQMPLVAQGPNQ